MPVFPFLPPVPLPPVYSYAMVAKRHMHEFGTTPEQLAWVKVAPHIMRSTTNTPRCARSSRSRRSLCLTDGRGSAAPPGLLRDDRRRRSHRCRARGDRQVAEASTRTRRRLRGKLKHPNGGWYGIVSSAGVQSGKTAFQQAGNIRDRYQIRFCTTASRSPSSCSSKTSLGFCERGQGKFVADGNLISGVGRLRRSTPMAAVFAAIIRATRAG